MAFKIKKSTARTTTAQPYESESGFFGRTQKAIFNGLVTVGNVLAVPQRTATALLSGTYQDPSKALGLTGGAGLATDIILDPLNLLTFGAGKGAQLAGQASVKRLTKLGTDAFNLDISKNFDSLKTEIGNAGFRSLGGSIWAKENVKDLRSAMEILNFQSKVSSSGIRAGGELVIDLNEAARISTTRKWLSDVDNLKKLGYLDEGGIKFGLPFLEGKTFSNGEIVSHSFNHIKKSIENALKKTKTGTMALQSFTKGAERLKRFGEEAFSTKAGRSNLPDFGKFSKRQFDIMREGVEAFKARGRYLGEDVLKINEKGNKVIADLMAKGEITKQQYQNIRDAIEKGGGIPSNIPESAKKVFEDLSVSIRKIQKDRLSINKSVIENRIRRELTKEQKEIRLEKTEKPIGSSSREFKVYGYGTDKQRMIDKFINSVTGDEVVGHIADFGFKEVVLTKKIKTIGGLDTNIISRLEFEGINNIDKLAKYKPEQLVSTLNGKISLSSAHRIIKRAKIEQIKQSRMLGFDKNGAMTKEQKEIVKLARDGGTTYKDQKGNIYIRESATITEINKKYEEMGHPLFQENVHILQALDEIENIKAINSYQIGEWVKKNKWAISEKNLIKKFGGIPDGWTETGIENLKGFYMPKEFSTMVDITNKVFFNNETAQTIYRLQRGVLNWWKSWTLAIFPSYHIRNHIDDFTRMTLAGMNPLNHVSYFKESFAIINRGGGMGQWDELARVGQYNHQEVYQMARDFGVIDSGGVFHNEIEDKIINTMIEQKVSPAKWYSLGSNNPAIKMGFEFGQNMESTRRLSLFMDRIRKGDSPVEASNHVKKWLFDYSDLTPFEREAMKSVFPFYTFFRKNIELQFNILRKSPRTHATFIKLGDSDEFPEEQRRSPNEIPFRVPKVLGELFGTSVNPNSSYYIDIANYISLGGIAQPFKPVDSLFSMLNPFAKYAGEVTTGYDFYRNRYIYPTEIEEFFGMPVTTRNPIKKGLELFRPISTADRIVNGWFGVMNETGEVPSALGQIMRETTGIKIQEFDPEKRKEYATKKQKREYSEAETIRRKKEDFYKKYNE